DPTVGPLMAAWGLVDMSGRVPPDEDIDALLEARGMDRVLVDEEAGTARFDRPGVMVDLGGIGKGYAVDRVARGLRDRGIEAGAVISGRSSIVAWGRPPGEDRWALDVVHPEDPEEALGTILAEPGAISSSGAYARRFVRGGKEYGHVLDPRTGRPARKIRGCTVWTESAVLGDVLSTALFVLGREAFESGGCAARLAEAWVPPDGAARVSALLVEEDPGVWGGLRTGCFHIGEPAFTLAPSGE
ncbi:MAG: FAD:protein FMN transferase, partial [Planctomycetes bacterium]|nr:FAD:protein FMN transferase [Planctomycetota bacterium]